MTPALRFTGLHEESNVAKRMAVARFAAPYREKFRRASFTRPTVLNLKTEIAPQHKAAPVGRAALGRRPQAFMRVVVVMGKHERDEVAGDIWRSNVRFRRLPYGQRTILFAAGYAVLGAFSFALWRKS